MTATDIPDPSRRQRRILGRCRSIGDLREAARRRLPRAVFDFIDGGAEDERTLAGNLEAFARFRFQPKALVDVADVATDTQILGGPSALPLVVAPFGAAGFPWTNGDLGSARAASKHGVPYAMSSTASLAMEHIAERVDGRQWFQCYIFKRREITNKLIERARNTGFEALVITVDLPVGGNRERDYCNDFSVPFRYTPRNVLDFALHPRWSLSTLARGLPTMANLAAFDGMDNINTAASTVGRNYDPSFDWDDLQRIRNVWPGKLIVKGISRGEDAQRLRGLGADAVVVSNHGGRQLDSALPTLNCLPEVRSAVGNGVEVMVDGGIRRGSDIVKALALGADAVMVGRAVLYGLAAGGADGAERALGILAQELRRTMQLLGVRRLGEIGPHLLAHGDLLAEFEPAVARRLLSGRKEKPVPPTPSPDMQNDSTEANDDFAASQRNVAKPLQSRTDRMGR